jgi:hypothetical protein
VFLLVACVAYAQKNDAVVGTWEGESICTVRPSPCHDEHVVYEIVDNKKLTLSADKVVNGQRENMGAFDCTFDGKDLRCPMKNGLWDFAVLGSELNGTLKLPDGTLYRKIHVVRKR